MRILLLILLLATGATGLFSQEKARKISGLVSSSDDRSPIEGVTIKAKVSGHTSGTQADGIYYISLSPQDSVLIFSFPGYATVEAAIGTSSEKNVLLVRANDPLAGQVFIKPDLYQDRHSVSSLKP